MKLARKLLPGIILLLIFTTSVAAMSAANYALEWQTGLMGSGGLAGSTHYSVNITLGQSAISPATGSLYQVGMGYWSGVLSTYPVFLPILLK